MRRLCSHRNVLQAHATGKPLGLAKNVRGGICPAGRDRTFEGSRPVGEGEEVESTAFF